MAFDQIREFGFGSAMDDHSYRSRGADGRRKGSHDTSDEIEKGKGILKTRRFSQPLHHLSDFDSYSSILYIMGLTPLANASASSAFPFLPTGRFTPCGTRTPYLMTQSLCPQNTTAQQGTFLPLRLRELPMKILEGIHATFRRDICSFL